MTNGLGAFMMVPWALWSDQIAMVWRWPRRNSVSHWRRKNSKVWPTCTLGFGKAKQEVLACHPSTYKTYKLLPNQWWLVYKPGYTTWLLRHAQTIDPCMTASEPTDKAIVVTMGHHLVQYRLCKKHHACLYVYQFLWVMWGSGYLFFDRASNDFPNGLPRYLRLFETCKPQLKPPHDAAHGLHLDSFG